MRTCKSLSRSTSRTTGTAATATGSTPGWCAIMLQQIYDAVRAQPELNAVRLVSGPLQGLAINHNAAVVYLQAVYREGKRRYGWGQDGKPFPFDGVGYHLYVVEEYDAALSPQAAQEELRAAYDRYVKELRSVIREQEGREQADLHLRDRLAHQSQPGGVPGRTAATGARHRAGGPRRGAGCVVLPARLRPARRQYLLWPLSPRRAGCRRTQARLCRLPGSLRAAAACARRRRL